MGLVSDHGNLLRYSRVKGTLARQKDRCLWRNRNSASTVISTELTVWLVQGFKGGIAFGATSKMLHEIIRGSYRLSRA